MSICRSRLMFAMRRERRSPDSNIIQNLKFQNSDGEDGGELFSQDISSSSLESPCGSPRRSTGSRCSTEFYDSGLGSPTPSDRKSLLSSKFQDGALSPIPFNMMEDCESDDDQILPLPTNLFTPPHKKFGTLRLYDTPQTPKSLLQRSQRRIITRPRSRNKAKENDRLEVNVNPFTPCNNNATMSRIHNNNNQGTKRPRQNMESGHIQALEDEIEEDFPTNKRLALHEINTSRYNEEFLEVCKLGDGEFGSVYKCINRLDGCTYAIKKSKTPVAGSAYERTAMTEVYAHAVVGKHPHVVRYYSAWAENDHMYIQDEYCNGGSLAEALGNLQQQGLKMSELDLKTIMLQIAKGLLYIHSQNLVHLDIKPGNIFIHRNPKPSSPESGLDEDMCDELDVNTTQLITYKIGDLGHVTSVSNPLVEEGDCRYLPREILQEEFDHLPKADIFSLALTTLVVGGCGELPKNGDAWHRIRQGSIPRLPQISEDFHSLLETMIHPDPQERPSSATLVHHPVLCPYSRKSKAQLRRELNEERFKNELLTRQLQQAKQGNFSQVPTQAPVNQPQGTRSSRLVGKKFKRSMSLNCF